MKALQTATAAIEVGAGAALLGLPGMTSELLVGAALETPGALTVARLGGAGLLALGVACWLARGDENSRAARALCGGMTVYNLGAVVVLAYAGLGLGLHGLALWPAVLLHTGMTAWCVASLRRQRA